MNLSIPPQLAVLVKYGRLQNHEITPAIVGEVATSLGFTASEKAIEDATAMIQSGDCEPVAQWMAIPSNRERLKKMLTGEQNDDILLRCTHCGNLIAFDPKTQLS